ncbi:MAG: hypothetical protein RI897_2587 [Verrucomicrobiota bacterium]
MVVGEERLYGGLPVVKNAEDVFLDEQAVDQAATEHGIGDLIPHAGLVSLGCKDMPMDPQPVGAAFLFVGEVVRWVPAGDFRLPAEGDAVNPEAIIDEGSGLHGDGGGGEDGKVQPGRGDGFEVFGVGEEAEGFLEREWQESILFEDESSHGEVGC